MSLASRDNAPSVFEWPMYRVAREIDESFEDLDYSLRTVAPYWLDQPDVQECNIGNSLGKAINNDEKFAVEVDVTQFRPDELSVSIQGNDLLIEGHHEERKDKSGCIERHFVRKCPIPEGVNPEAIQSHLSDHGVLSISANKALITSSKSRAIPIQAALRQRQRRPKQSHGDSEE